jgi:hypothetical protein
METSPVKPDGQTNEIAQPAPVAAVETKPASPVAAPVAAASAAPVADAPAGPSAWSSVTNDLHLTFSGLIVFLCVLGSIWVPSLKEQFGATAAAAGVYLTGRATKNGNGNGH